MRSKTFAADQQSLLGHEPHLGKRRVVAGALVQGIVHLAHGGGAQAPEDRQDVGLGRGRHGGIGFGSHLDEDYHYKNLTSTIKILVVVRRAGEFVR